jgi:hypothetical protein
MNYSTYRFDPDSVDNFYLHLRGRARCEEQNMALESTSQLPRACAMAIVTDKSRGKSDEETGLTCGNLDNPVSQRSL